MEKELVKKANLVVEEIKQLENYKNIFNKANKHHTLAHFEIVQHYGNPLECERVVIDRRHNDRLINEIDKIILELELELERM